jgi:hypothetical protein
MSKIKNADEKTVLMFGLSQAMKDAVGEWASKNDRATAEVVRTAVAEYIGYDMAKDPKKDRKGRNKKYNSVEERKAAQKDRDRENRRLVKELLERHRKEQRQADADAVEKSLKKRRVKV